MKRDEFKLLAAGQYAYMQREATIDKQGLDTFVEGALFGYDMVFKILNREPQYKVEESKNTPQTPPELTN